MQPNSPSAEYTGQTEVFRATLRSEKIAARQALPADLLAAHALHIEAALEALLADAPATVLGFCWPVRQEFDARPLAERLLSRGGSACLPVVVAEATPLQFRTWTPGSKMTPDRYGIPTPIGGELIVPDVLLIPLVAFDTRNFRIGYGGGFFDRTLAALSPRPLAIGVGYEISRVEDTRPGKYDIALDVIVTEATVQRR
jgi:5,10-methenyltetrahydrofolate synthetase